MIDDFRALEDGSELTADICIIGAGAAGITLAHALAGGSARVLLLESGGLELEGETQELYQGDIIGLPYMDLDATRLRYFGGTTNHWGGYCMPMHEIDFETRPWVGHSGWPLTRSEIDPYYRKAAQICGLSKFSFELERWQAIGLEPPPFEPTKLSAIIHQLGPVRFGEVYRNELKTARNVRVLLNANVIDIAVNSTASEVDHVRIQALSGKSGKVKARFFVLACGGMENVRLLLSSTGVEPNGLGNRHDLVGRFFMDHLMDPAAGKIVTDKPDRLIRMFLHRWLDGVANVPGFRITDRIQRQEQCLNGGWLVYTDADRKGGLAAARKLWLNLKREGRWPDHLGHKIWRIVSDLDDVSKNAYREFVLGKEPIAAYRTIILKCWIEPAPNPDSRLTLSEDRDALGLRKLKLNWRLSDIDRHTFRVVAESAAAELARTGLGRTQLAEWLFDEQAGWPDFEITHHHMGTTRMADDPRQGVVQRDCRIHGVDNFYIAGSSVFPTVSHTGTTITIVALALRLADHLRARLV
ncbi:MAG: GMC family oxidoreductase [Alphaproteobacteria bacterium]|nr:GMC family oxidoreductase [Alphaproteobacteria bacterium]